MGGGAHVDGVPAALPRCSNSDRAMLSARRLYDSTMTVSWKATSAAGKRGMSSRDVRISSRVPRNVGGVGAFDMALWDLRAKMAQEPLWP